MIATTADIDPRARTRKAVINIVFLRFSSTWQHFLQNIDNVANKNPVIINATGKCTSSGWIIVVFIISRLMVLFKISYKIIVIFFKLTLNIIVISLPLIGKIYSGIKL